MKSASIEFVPQIRVELHECLEAVFRILNRVPDTFGHACHELPDSLGMSLYLLGMGDDYRANKTSPRITSTGLTIIGKSTVIPPGQKIGRNCIIYDNVAEDDFPEPEMSSGETIRPKRKPIRIRA